MVKSVTWGVLVQVAKCNAQQKISGIISSYGVERTVNNFHLASIVAQVLVLEFSTSNHHPLALLFPAHVQIHTRSRWPGGRGTALEHHWKGMMRHTWCVLCLIIADITAVLLNCDMWNTILWWIKRFKNHQLFEIDLSCRIINVFIVTFEQFIASFLNKYIN